MPWIRVETLTCDEKGDLLKVALRVLEETLGITALDLNWVKGCASPTETLMRGRNVKVVAVPRSEVAS
jgi:hypothetical protein